METAILMLNKIKPGHATILWDKIVWRRGDKFIVGQTVNTHADGISIEEAAAILCKRD